MTWTIQYKCRRCGDIQGGICGSVDTCKNAIMYIAVNGEPCRGLGGTVWLTNIHHCRDGGQGISDIVGAGPYE